MNIKQSSLFAVVFATLFLEPVAFSQVSVSPSTSTRLNPTVLVAATTASQPSEPRPLAVQQTQTESTTFKLRVVVSKFEGDKRISNEPYLLRVIPGQTASLRLGSEVPVPTTSAGTSGTTSYTLQQSGIQISSTVSPASENKFKLSLSVTDRFQSGTRDVGAIKIPIFSNRVISSNAILADGQSIQFTSGVDSVTGETWTVDVTLNVEK